MQRDASGHEYKPTNEESFAICWAILLTIRASHLNTFDPALSVQHKFNGKLRRQKKHTQDFTSLALFRDDVECLLRDLYGDVESEALDSVVWAVLRIVRSRDMCAQIFAKNMRMPRILTTCVGSVCHKDVRLVAVSLVKEWQPNVVSSTVPAR
jgi:hypothetical protein